MCSGVCPGVCRAVTSTSPNVNRSPSLIFSGVEAVLCAAFATGVNLRRVEPRAQFARTTHQIGVNMRLENVRDRYAGFASCIDVNVAVRARIEHGGNSFVIIADQIGKLSNAFCLDGFKYQ